MSSRLIVIAGLAGDDDAGFDGRSDVHIYSSPF
jgi:hypothetical protein